MPHSVHPTPRTNTPAQECPTSKYWNLFQPEEKWTEECPPFLVGISEKNIKILSRKDEDFARISWEKAQDLVRTNKIDQFERNSSQLRGYLEYIYKVKNEYGSVLLFIQKERLHWDSTTPSGDVPFSNLTDYKILYNDWPYHIDETIKHLVVWTKFQIADDPITEDVKVEDKAYIENFIQETFCSRATGVGKTISRDQITWFRNWKSLKSVHALEHIHIMLYKAPAELLERVTNGDRPTSEQWYTPAVQN